MKTPKVLYGAAALCAIVSVVAFSNQGSQETAAAPETSQAPVPAETFESITCPIPEDVNVPTNIAANTWIAPSIGAQAHFSVSDVLPAAADTNDGILYSPSEELASAEGASLLAGHVDYAPGALSEKGGELTDWGHLNKLQPCTLVFTADANGTVRASQVITKIVEPQRDAALEDYVALHPEDDEAAQRLKRQREVDGILFRSTGEKSTVLLTCSGEAVKDVGGEFQFRYENNLIIDTRSINLS